MAKLRLRDRSKAKPPPTPRRASSLDEDVPDRDVERAAAVIAKTPPPSRRTVVARLAEIRRVAAQEFITDPEARTVSWWHARDDRPYRTAVPLKTFEGWASADEWPSRRDHFWQRVEQRVLEHVQHELLQQRLREIAKITPTSDALLEYLSPRRDEDGRIVRYAERLPGGAPHPFAGLPVIPLINPEDPPYVEKVIKGFIDIHKLLMTKRGEVTQRSATVDQGAGGNPLAVVDPVASAVPFSQEQISQLAQLALRMRQPELEGDALDKIAAYEREQAEADAAASEDDNGSDEADR